MKIHLHHILCVSFMVILTISGKSYAQDNNLAYLETSSDKYEYDRLDFVSGETDNHDTRLITIPRTGTDPKDTVTATPVTSPAQQQIQQTAKIKIEKSATPATKPAVEKHSKKEDDSILTFNFLYYIIEKYKLQDIVD
jgi:hypothetical protein